MSVAGAGGAHPHGGHWGEEQGQHGEVLQGADTHTVINNNKNAIFCRFLMPAWLCHPPSLGRGTMLRGRASSDPGAWWLRMRPAPTRPPPPPGDTSLSNTQMPRSSWRNTSWWVRDHWILKIILVCYYQVKTSPFPSCHQIARKDNLWHSFRRMQQKYGRQHFDFLSDSFTIPEQRDSLVEAMEREPGSYWIVKPPGERP